jgi:peptidoglycan/LPS O-acetylase OafA/YrhL
VSERRPYWPALDGVRAAAIGAVVVYHLGHLASGWMGVDIFFVLSGYLITTLLLSERVANGRIRLARFWARRARRLLPAVLLLLVVLGVYAWAGGPGLVPAQLRSPALATLFYVANWQQIIAAHSYFAAFSAPSPLVHTWSLAIEEQYYLVWPLVVVGVLSLGARRRPAGRTPRALLALTLVLIVASAAWMGVLAHLDSVNRAYLGTDSRAWELLIGGAAAMVFRPGAAEGALVRRWAWLSGAGALGVAAALAAASVGAPQSPPGWVWDGGLVGLAVAAVVVILGVTRAPTGPVARLLSLPPVRWLGRLSYSLYLWHWPVIDLVNPTTTGWRGAPLLGARLGLMTVAMCASYYLVERPLRQAQWGRWWRRSLVPLSVGATGALLLVATVPPALAGTGALARATLRPTAGAPAATTFRLADPATNRPLRAWILGDSVMNDSSPGVTAALEATGDIDVVADSSFGGWGLTTDTHWSQDAAQILAQYHPQVVIGTWSWDDPMAEQQPAAYTALLHQFLSTLLAPGDGVELVVLLQFPVTGPSPLFTDPVAGRAHWAGALRGENAWDAIAQQEAGRFPGQVLYLTTAQLFAPHGRFLTWMRTPGGSWVRARKVDGTHVCPYGAAALGQLVTTDLTPVLGLAPPRSGWQDGSWRLDPRYNDPPGACPSDQPPPGYDGQPVPVATSG